MARLLRFPLNLPIVSMEPLSGPRTFKSGATTSIGMFEQTVKSPFGLWRWQFGLAPMRGQMFREYRGWATALHGGANATRFDFFDPDRLTPAESGINVRKHLAWTSYGMGQPWANGENWSNGKGWKLTPELVPVANSASRDDTDIMLTGVHWGASLGVGSFIGFTPSHFGLYEVTEVIGDGEYRIWPPLRADVGLDTFATLEPVLAMRLESEEAASSGRGLSVAEGITITMVEVPDYTVKAHFADLKPIPSPRPWVLADQYWNDGGIWSDEEAY